MKDIKTKYFFLILVLALILGALALDLIASRVTVELSLNKVLDKNDQIISVHEIVYPYSHQIMNVIKNFLYALAGAIFITIFISNELEKSQRENEKKRLEDLNKDININVFDSLFKTLIPEEVFKAIKQDIIENKVIRKNAIWSYVFSEESTDNIICIMTTTYRAYNLSQKTIKNPITLSFDSLGQDPYELLLSECTSHDGEILARFNHEDKDQAYNCEIKPEGNLLYITYTVDIPPDQFVTYKTMTKRKFPLGMNDGQFTNIPVIGGEVIVTHPKDYQFYISPVMSSPLDTLTETDTQKVYRVQGALLPKQGFMFNLQKKNTTTTTSN